MQGQQQQRHLRTFNCKSALFKLKIWNWPFEILRRKSKLNEAETLLVYANVIKKFNRWKRWKCCWLPNYDTKLWWKNLETVNTWLSPGQLLTTNRISAGRTQSDCSFCDDWVWLTTKWKNLQSISQLDQMFKMYCNMKAHARKWKSSRKTRLCLVYPTELLAFQANGSAKEIQLLSINSCFLLSIQTFLQKRNHSV